MDQQQDKENQGKGIFNERGDTRPIRPGDCEIAKLDRSGDTKTIWNPDNEDEVANAKRTFDDLRKKGYLAFRVIGKEGDKGEQMTEFDPRAGRMIMVPQMRGG
jgi:hypothetical protein